MPRPRPLVLMTLAFTTGILLASFALTFLWVLLLLTVAVSVRVIGKRRSSLSSASSNSSLALSASSSTSTSSLMILIYLVFALFGGLRYLASNFVAPNDVSHLAPLFSTISGVVVSDVTIQPPLHAGQKLSGKFILEARQVGTEASGRSMSVSGLAATRVPLRSAESRPHYGDVLIIRGRLERPEGARNPGGFDYATMLQRRGIYATLTARRFDDWHIKSTADYMSGNPMEALALKARSRVVQHGQAAHTRERAGVLNGILLGDRGDLPGTLNEDFERTGTSHVLATAGLHVGVVVGLLLGFLRLSRIARNPAMVVAFLSLIFYAMMAGGRPSITRAVIIASIVLIGMLVEREPCLPVALALAALILLCANPQNLFEPGFQLSFATVITIVLLMPLAANAMSRANKRVQDDWPGAKLLRFIIDTLVACFFLAIASFLGCAPLIAYYFNDVSLISIFANTLVVPVIALIIALGFSAVGLSAIHPLLALPLDRLLDILLTWVISVVRACSLLPYASLPVASPPEWFLIIYYAALWGSAGYIARSARTSKQKEAGIVTAEK